MEMNKKNGKDLKEKLFPEPEGLEDVDIELDPARASRHCDDFHLDEDEEEDSQDSLKKTPK